MCACCPWSTAASALTWTVPGISQSPCARWAAGWDGPERPSGRRWREGERAAGTNHLTARKEESGGLPFEAPRCDRRDRKSTRLNSSHVKISYAVFCLKKKKK